MYWSFHVRVHVCKCIQCIYNVYTIYMYTCVNVYCIHVYTCMHTYVNIYLYMYIYVYSYIQVYMYNMCIGICMLHDGTCIFPAHLRADAIDGLWDHNIPEQWARGHPWTAELRICFNLEYPNTTDFQWYHPIKWYSKKICARPISVVQKHSLNKTNLEDLSKSVDSQHAKPPMWQCCMASPTDLYMSSVVKILVSQCNSLVWKEFSMVFKSHTHSVHLLSYSIVFNRFLIVCVNSIPLSLASKLSSQNLQSHSVPAVWGLILWISNDKIG